MRKPIMVDPTAPCSLSCHLGNGMNAYLYGSVAKGTSIDKSDIDIYVTGPCASKIEERFMFKRPPVIFEGNVYPMHIVGPITVAEETFFLSQPEARLVYAQA